MSSKVHMLQTDLMMCLLRSVGSKQTCRLPLGFFTMTNEFNYSGVSMVWVTSDKMPCWTMDCISVLNLSFSASGTL